MKFRTILLLAAGLMAGNAAFAQGFYAGGALGFTNIEDSEDGVTYSDTPLGFRLVAGYDINENFGVEGAYVTSGTANDTIDSIEVEAELSGFVISFLGHLPINEQLNVFGKLGYYTGETDVSAFGITVSEDADGVTAGAGLRYDFANNLTLRGDLDWYDSDLDTLWTVGVGLQFRFDVQ